MSNITLVCELPVAREGVKGGAWFLPADRRELFSGEGNRLTAVAVALGGGMAGRRSR